MAVTVIDEVQPRAQAGTVRAGAGHGRPLRPAIRNHCVHVQIGKAQPTALEGHPDVRARGVTSPDDEGEGAARPRVHESQGGRKRARHPTCEEARRGRHGLRRHQTGGRHRARRRIRAAGR